MLLKMSISGSILIILIMIFRFFAINKLPKKMFVLLWNIAILRLLLPFDLPIHYGIASPITNIIGSGVIHNPVTNTPTITETSKELVADPIKLSLDNATWTAIIWMTGMLLLLLIFGILYWLEYQKIQTALPVSEETDQDFRSIVTIPDRVKLLISDRISTPLTFGILSPKIIFPKILKLSDETEIKCVLTHELIHIKRFDNLWKIMVLIVVSIYWFNPFVWIMYVLFNRDIELSCDEKVIILLGETTKKAYITTLINLAEKQYQWSFISNGFGKNPIQERIVALMKFKRTSYISIGCAAFLLTGAITVFAQNDSKTIENPLNHNELVCNGKSIRRTKEELSHKMREVINSCDDKKWYVIDDTKYQYVYFNDLPANYAYQPEIDVDKYSGTIHILDMGTSTGNYVLLEIDQNVFLTIFYNHSQVTYTKLFV